MLLGNRIYIRPLEYFDLPYRVKLLNNEEINSGITIDSPISLAKTQKWFNDIIYDDTKIHFVIADINTNDLLGITGIVNKDSKNLSGEIYIAIGEKSHWGHGFGSEALQLLLKYSIVQLHLNRIYLYTDIDNHRAQRMYEKNGFVKEGILRQHKYHNGKLQDYILYAMLKSQLDDETKCTKEGFL